MSCWQALYSRARSIYSSTPNFLSTSRLLNFSANIITLSLKGFFFVTVAEGAEGPSSGFEVIGRELAELDEGRSQEAMDNFFAQSHYTIHHKQNYFIQHTMSDSFTKKTV